MSEPDKHLDPLEQAAFEWALESLHLPEPKELEDKLLRSRKTFLAGAKFERDRILDILKW